MPPSLPSAHENPPAATIFVNIAGAQNVPSPVRPASHVQVNDPGVLAHAACAAQGGVVAAHSLMSLQATPLPSKPVLHTHARPSEFSAHVASGSHRSPRSPHVRPDSPQAPRQHTMQSATT